MKRNEVPRSGTHNGIKYNKKRTIIRICRVCKKYFLIQGRGMAKAQFCSKECKKINNTDYQQYWYGQLPVEVKSEINNRRENQRTTNGKISSDYELKREFERAGLKWRG